MSIECVKTKPHLVCCSGRIVNTEKNFNTFLSRAKIITDIHLTNCRNILVLC